MNPNVAQSDQPDDKFPVIMFTNHNTSNYQRKCIVSPFVIFHLVTLPPNLESLYCHRVANQLIYR